MEAEKEVRAALDAYYQANLTGESREGFFVQDNRVTTMHPQGGRQTGWAEVGAAERRWSSEQKMWLYRNAELRDVAINVVGDVAWAAFMVHVELEVADEEPLVMDVRVTNVYEKHGSEWLIALHHDSITDIEVLQRLQSLQKVAPKTSF